MPIQRKETVLYSKPKNDAYVGMLAISLVALLIGSVLLFIEYSRYPDKKPDEPIAPVSAKTLASGPAAAPQPGPPGQPPVNPMPMPMPMPMAKDMPKDKDAAKDKDK